MSDIIAGGITGVLQWVIGHPIDTIKVLMQNNMKWCGLPFRQYYNGGSYKLVGSFIFNTIVFFLTSTFFLLIAVFKKASYPLYRAPFLIVL